MIASQAGYGAENNTRPLASESRRLGEPSRRIISDALSFPLAS